ncbi:MAG: tRNA (adenosine(37)-N6)-dimethylallyltransferase MiaA [Candidatus Gracilibacteria bacterium]|jgi:tRNA dimethylallyltransferase|nr:tRNA (adenosine(37)-N6)-dimethylallyltransferase MiaA [Candidatus Gracilibacteria bacterium]
MKILQKIKQFVNINKNPIINIIGTTASGKTALSVKIAHEINGEIINADSRQVFKGLDIATYKIKPQETKGIPHYLFSFIEPDQLFTLAEWQDLATNKAFEILKSKKIPILCGGTALYVNAITKGFDISRVEPQDNFRKKMEQLNNQEVHDLLKQKDPLSAQKYHPNNKKAVIRALEVTEFSKSKKSDENKTKSPFSSMIIGIQVDRKKLYERIDQRVYEMLKEGLIEEVQEMLKKGYKKDHPLMISHGVPECIDYLEKKIKKDQFIEKMQKNTRNFAKRQLTWWRRDPRVIWVNPETMEIVDSGEI